MAPRGRLRLGCISGLLFGVLVAAGVFALIAPWSFHIGDRWTPLLIWQGVGELRDSTGARYGLYAMFYPYPRGTGKLGGPSYHIGIKGNAKICTASGAVFPFALSGGIRGGWLNTDGSRMSLSIGEKTQTRPRRHFELVGYWKGPVLPLDDQKTMFMYFLPDGSLTPARSYTSPVPEKHAKVTLTWGSTADFDRLCSALAGPR